MLSVHLANIKSSGVYRFVFDKSEVTNNVPQTLRLVVGYSEKGPFNTVTYVKNESEFKEIYGGISKKLEKYGCYFHRMALQCLSKEPILCLNLKKFTPKPETNPQANVNYETVKGLTLSAFRSDATLNTADIEVEKIFNTNRLWTLDPEVLPSAFTNSNFISISQTDEKKCSDTVYIRPSSVKGFNVTLRDWYNSYCSGEYPDYVESALDTLVSDYMVDVFIFRGKFTSDIAQTDTFSKYFIVNGDNVYVKDYIENAYGEKIDALQALAEVEGSGFLSKYTGSLIPYFKNTDGSWMSIDLLVNYDTTSHNVMMYLDESKFGIEFTISNINLGGYNDNFSTLGKISSYYGTAASSAVYNYNIIECTASGSNITSKVFTYGDVQLDNITGITKGSDTTITCPKVCANVFSVGDWFIGAADSKNLVKVISIEDVDNSTVTITFSDKVRFITAGSQNSILRYHSKLTSHASDLNSSSSFVWVVKTLQPYDNPSDYNKDVATAPTAAGEKGYSVKYYKSVLVSGTTYKWEEYTPAEGETAPTTEINLNTAPTTADDKGKVTTYYVSISLSEGIDNKSQKGTYLEGYTYLSGKPNSTSIVDRVNWINGILDVLSNKGLREALTNSTDTEYRYIVDSFEGLPEDNLRGRLSLLAKEKENAFVISNFPSIKILAKEKAWCDNNGFNTKYIVSGHNRSVNTPLNISLPAEVNGASFIGFFTSLKFNDGGLKIDVPSAGLVSNNFMDKYTSRQPYYVVAGPSYGRMSYAGMIGPDFNFTREDLDNLEPMGVNCMVYKPQRGTFINSNQTAKQTPVTGLSKINIRELVIYLQDTIADMLQGYQWELNTTTLRSNIKAKADAICEAVKSNGGLYEYINVCDETNNTDEVIDNEMVILSTSIEPAKGAGKMVHELTIYRKGGMSSIIK